MFKKLHSYAVSVVSLCCIFSMLFLNTLHVEAVTNAWALVGSTVIDETATNVTVNFKVQANREYAYSSGGTYSGSASGTYDGKTNISLSGTTIQNGVTSNSGTASTSSSIRLTGSASGSVSGSQNTGTGYWSGTWSSNYSSGVNISGNAPSYSVSTSGTSSSSGTTSVSGNNNASSGDISLTSSSGTITMSSTHGGSTLMHFRLPFEGFFPLANGVSIDPNSYYGVFHTMNMSSPTVTSGTLSHIVVTDETGSVICSPDESARNIHFYLGSQLLSSDDQNYKIGMPLFVEFDYFLYDYIPTDVTLTFTLYPRIRVVRPEYQSSVGNSIVSDVEGHKIQEQTNSELSDLNATEEDTNETTHDIFDSISDFFGSFFTNLIGVFVPEDGFFTTWFNNLNTLLSQKLGVLYYPFSVVIDIMTRLNNAFEGAQSNSCVIVFPELKLNMNGQSYTIIERHEIDLIDYNIPIYNADTSNSQMFGMSSLIWVIRRLNNFIILFAIIKLFISKLNLILRGSEEG